MGIHVDEEGVFRITNEAIGASGVNPVDLIRATTELVTAWANLQKEVNFGRDRDVAIAQIDRDIRITEIDFAAAKLAAKLNARRGARKARSRQNVEDALRRLATNL